MVEPTRVAALARLSCATCVASFLGLAYAGCGSVYADYCTRMNECNHVNVEACVDGLEEASAASAQIGCTDAHQMVTDCQARTGWCKRSFSHGVHWVRWIEACSLEAEALGECVERGIVLTCGNGACDYFEDCGSCPSDCGSCPCEGDGPCE